MRDGLFLMLFGTLWLIASRILLLDPLSAWLLSAAISTVPSFHLAVFVTSCAPQSVLILGYSLGFLHRKAALVQREVFLYPISFFEVKERNRVHLKERRPLGDIGFEKVFSQPPSPKPPNFFCTIAEGFQRERRVPFVSF